jgi:hypothetical protein
LGNPSGGHQFSGEKRKKKEKKKGSMRDIITEKKYVGDRLMRKSVTAAVQPLTQDSEATLVQIQLLPTDWQPYSI